MTQRAALAETTNPLPPHEHVPKPRQLWMDLLRGLAIFLVITFHSASILGRHGYTAPAWLEGINWGFALFRMPMLVFLSGLLLPASLRKSLTVFTIGKLRHILWPLLVWSLIFSITLSPHSNPVSAFANAVAGGAYLWYLSFILLYYFVSVPLRRVHPLLVAAGALGIAFLCPDGSKYGERLFYLMAFFFMGAWAGQHWQRWIAVVHSRTTLIAWFPAIVASAVAIRYHYAYGPWYALPALCFIVAVAATTYRVQHWRVTTPFIFIGRNSLIFYVIHFPLIYGVIATMRALDIASGTLAALAGLGATLATGSMMTHGAKASSMIRLLFTAPELPDTVRTALERIEARMTATR